MVHAKTKDECQKAIAYMITRAEEDLSSLTDDNALLLSTMEDVHTVTQIAKNLYRIVLIVSLESCQEVICLIYT